MQRSGLRVWNSAGLGCRVSGLGLKSSGFTIQGRVDGLGFGVQGLR